MGALGRWLRTTFDYNPTFPLSALALLVGLRLLDREGGLDTGTVGGAAGGVGLLEAYELALLGVALLFLWPRRIAYETTSILIIAAVVRFAAPFAVASAAADLGGGAAGGASGGGGAGGLAAVLGLGLALAVLMPAKLAWVHRRVGLELAPWERRLDAGLYAACALGLPLLAERLAAWTGGALSHAGARALHLALWWGAALALAPLARGLPDLAGARQGPLASRVPAAVWRGTVALAVPALLANALWLGGEAPTPLQVLPVALVLAAVGGAIARAAGVDADRVLAHAPGLAALVVVVAPAEWLLGRGAPFARPGALLLFLPVAAALVPLVAPTCLRAGWSTVGLALAAAPLAVLPDVHAAEVYLLALAAAAAGVGAWRRHDLLLGGGALAAATLAAHLAWREAGGLGGTDAALLAGAAAAALAAWRLPRGPWAAGVATGLALAPGALVLARDAGGLPALTLAAAAVGALAWRRDDRLLAGLAGGLWGLVLLRRGAAGADPGVVLVLLAFGALPLGAWLAVRRERAAARAVDARPAPLRAPGARPVEDDLPVLGEGLAGLPAEVDGRALSPVASAA